MQNYMVGRQAWQAMLYVPGKATYVDEVGRLKIYCNVIWEIMTSKEAICAHIKLNGAIDELRRPKKESRTC